MINEILEFNRQFVAEKGYEVCDEQVSRQETCHTFLYGHSADRTSACCVGHQEW